MVIHKDKDFDYAKTWSIFWTRAQRQWKKTVRDKEYELRNIHQRGSKTKSMWKGITRQLKPLGRINKRTFTVTCRINWKTHETNKAWDTVNNAQKVLLWAGGIFAQHVGPQPTFT